MPVKIKGDDGQIYDMPWEGANLPTDDDVNIWLKHNTGENKPTSTLSKVKQKVDSFIGSRLDQLGQKKPGILNPNPDENPAINKPLLPPMPDATPEMKSHLATRIPYNVTKFGYDNVLRPLTSVTGAYGLLMGSHPADISELPKVSAKPRLGLPPAPPEIANPPKFIGGSEGVALNRDYPLSGGRSAPPNIVANGAVDDFSRPAQSLGSAADLDQLAEQRRLANVKMSPETWSAKAAGRGVLELLDQPNMPIPAVSGDRHLGFNPQSFADLPYPENVVPNSVRPRTVQSNMGRTVPERFTEPLGEPGEPITFDNAQPEPINDVPQGSNEYQLPSARQVSRSEKLNNLPEPTRGPDLETIANDPREMRERNGFPLENTPVSINRSTAGTNQNPIRRLLNNEKGELTIPGGKPKANTSISGNGNQGNSGGRSSNTSPATSNDLTYRPIPVETPVKDAVKQWAYGRNAAKFRGELASDSFKDVSEPTLIDKYESGNREGRLADIQKRLDSLHELGKKAGIFGEDQKVPNYLRHEFDNSEEEITAAVNQYVAKNPSIAKTRKFPSYAQAEASGLKRKFETIPELMSAYESKLTTAIRNKEFYDYLKGTGRLAKGSFSTKPTDWTFKGPDAETLKTLVGNYFSESPSGIKAVADATSASKNLYLGGGIGGTKYNMHVYNISRSDAKLAGFGRATGELLSDPTGNKGVEVYNSLKHWIPDLVEHGYVAQPIEDLPEHRLGTNIVSKGLNVLENTFEKPLFQKALPALKLKRTVEVFQKLEPTLGREKALTEAANIGNEFYGGINKALRNKTNTDLSRIIFLAPDWLESRLLLAKRDYVGLAKTLSGQGNVVDAIGAKSAARGMAVGLGTMGAGYLTSGKLPSIKTKPGDVLTVPAGQSGKKNREIDTFGTSDEGVRIPIQSALKAFKGDPTGLLDAIISNRLSTPLKTGINIVRGQDDFGNPLKGKDKYGKKISEGKAIMNYLGELSRPAQLQAIQGIIKYANGDASLEEALTTAAELPVKYSKKPRNSRASSGMSMGGLRMPR
jgi:hypothetical protein